VLSYSWGSDKVKVGNSSEGYSISRRLLTMKFDNKTWVDAISHFGDDELVQRTLSRMGGIYRERAEWLEHRPLLPAVEAFSRMWIWQEQALRTVVVPTEREKWQLRILAIIRGQVSGDMITWATMKDDCWDGLEAIAQMFRVISGCTEQAIVEASQNDKIGGNSQFKDRLASLIYSSASKFSLSALPILVNGPVNPKVATSLLRPTPRGN
jgi:hypothetical protein